MDYGIKTKTGSLGDLIRGGVLFAKTAGDLFADARVMVLVHCSVLEFAVTGTLRCARGFGFVLVGPLPR